MEADEHGKPQAVEAHYVKLGVRPDYLPAR